MKRFFFNFIVCVFLIACIPSISVSAERNYEAEAEERKKMPVETNMYMNWPTGPSIGAQSAILMDMNCGAILYEKNIHEKLYPASITKILTALIAYDSCDMDDMITFSSEAVNSIDWRHDANMGINAGDSITMEQCLYGLLVGSANEAAYAIAEHICGPGNISGFAEKMNVKAKELGCVDSHFVTPNGIHDPEHYTSAYDMALIAQAFYSNELLAKMARTPSYQIPKSDTQPRDDMIVWAKSKLLEGKEYAYEPLVGTKTGYTDDARQTLVSCAEKNNMKLICVILKEEAPNQFLDTINLFEYGFKNFVPHKVIDEDSSYQIDTSNNYFSSNNEFIGSDKPIMEIKPTDYIVLPVNVDFDDTTSEIDYNQDHSKIVARIHYYLDDIPVGHADIIPITEENNSFKFSSPQMSKQNGSDLQEKIIYVNVKIILLCIIGISLILSFIFFLFAKYKDSNKYRQRGHGFRKYKNKSRQLDWKHFK